MIVCALVQFCLNFCQFFSSLHLFLQISSSKYGKLRNNCITIPAFQNMFQVCANIFRVQGYKSCFTKSFQVFGNISILGQFFQVHANNSTCTKFFQVSIAVQYIELGKKNSSHFCQAIFFQVCAYFFYFFKSRQTVSVVPMLSSSGLRNSQVNSILGLIKVENNVHHSCFDRILFKFMPIFFKFGSFSFKSLLHN